MRYPVAWSDVISQNVTLRTAVFVLCAISTALTLVVAKIALKEPLIIERACYSTAVDFAAKEPTDAEIETFVREAIRQRFESGAPVIEGFLSTEEEAFRKQEQEELKNGNMTQRVIVTAIKREGAKVAIEADRLISVGTVRSAFPFPLSLVLSSKRRSSQNPYGLTLASVSTPGKNGGPK